MLKLFKYEWRKQLFSKLIIGCILLGLTALYILGTVLDKEWWAELAMVFLVAAGMFAALYVGIESLLVLNRDIRTKESYMLFMVPKSAYQILGAKLLAAVCQIFLTLAMFAGAFMICFTAYMTANEGLAGMLNYLRFYIQRSFSVEIQWGSVAILLVQTAVAWINTIAVGFAAIISVRTVLSRTKLAGVIAFVVFLLLNWATSRIVGQVSRMTGALENGMAYDWAGIGVMALITLILLIFSGWMAEKKLSV